MKFTDGYWRIREGMDVVYPVQALDVTPEAGGLTAYVAAKPVRDRGDLLDGPLFTYRAHAPMDGVIGVTITHFAGQARRGPDFTLFPEDGYAPQVTAGDGAAQLQAGPLTLRFCHGSGWGMELYGDGRRLTGTGARSTAFIGTADGRHHVREQLDLGVDHHVYGLGERFGPLVRNGQTVDLWNADGGTTSEQAYKNVPFLLTDAGYGIFVDHPGRVSLEVASEAVSRLQFSVEDQSLTYYVVYGPTPKEILRRYTALTGRPARLPAWSFGLWLSTSFTTSYDEETVASFVDGMAERDLPLSVFHFDCFWMRELNWCDFAWDSRTFPDPPGMLRRLKERGLRVCVWINPYIAQRSPLFEEGRHHGYLLRRPDGDVWQWDHWQPGLAVVDFTNPDARRWYADKLATLLDMGVDCFKTDFGERIPTDVVYFDGSDPERMHNHYAYQYNETVFELLRERRGDGEAIVFGRAATAGTQRFPVNWGGDPETTFASMAEALRGGLSLGISGFGYWSHDIGGFVGAPDAAVFKRWIPFGLLSSHSRLHGESSYRVPWLFDDEAVDVLKRFTRLKARLMPYLMGAARQAWTSGTPMMRAMVLEFPDDPACAYLERQYMLGDDLLVAPVFTASGEVTYYVPAGTWTQLLTGETVVGPRWVTEEHGFESLPVLARPGSVIPYGAVDDRPDYAHADGVTLRIHALPDGAAVRTEIPGPDGEVTAAFTSIRTGSTITVHAERGPEEWSVLLTGVSQVAELSGGDAADHPHGLRIHATARQLRITTNLGEGI